jgi:thiamine biosynthesis lipoprotein
MPPQRERAREDRPDVLVGEHQRHFELFGTTVRVVVGGPAAHDSPRPEIAAAAAEAVLRSCHLELTRFDPTSELSRLNADPEPSRITSRLVAGAVAAAVRAAERSGGLVDPALLGEIESAGYAESRYGATPAQLADALAVAPPRRPAAPSHRAMWRAVSVVGREVRRPPGVGLDLGGTGKGFAADRAAASLARQATFAVDAGGDIVLGGTAGRPRLVTIAHPLEDRAVARFPLAAGAVATSGMGTRIWRTESGFAHHLLDPSTGRPAWTGAIQATALAATGLEAETLAKTALLLGPERGLRVLEPAGGALVLDDGHVLLAGPLRLRAVKAA